MKNLLRLQDLSTKEILNLIHDAKKFKEGTIDFNLKGKIIANLFFEPSTRTQYSFNVAEEMLGMKVISFNASNSSLLKGETFYDTIKTFESFLIDAVVIRHTKDEYYKELESIKIPIINAGDGKKDHPSQCLLDLFTIYEEFGYFEGLKVCIVGDIKHSRVAHSNIEVMTKLGMKCFTSGPMEYSEAQYEHIDFNQCVQDMDVVMLLRVQNERHDKLEMSNETYLRDFGMTLDKVKKMKKNAIIMHPAPFNRGVEIADDVVECSKSRIYKQITNGVFCRCAILKRSFE